jgi:hypothetical protein
MSFGIGIGDFIKVVEVAQKVRSISHRFDARAHSALWRDWDEHVGFQRILTISQIVSKCKAATLEFRDLSRDVVSMQIVLDAVQIYWEKQKLNGRDLLDSQKENLNELTNNCRDVLHEIEALLQRHGGLEAGTGLLNRLKWLRAGDLGPLRMRLLASTMYLSEFNRNVV